MAVEFFVKKVAILNSGRNNLYVKVPKPGKLEKSKHPKNHQLQSVVMAEPLILGQKVIPMTPNKIVHRVYFRFFLVKVHRNRQVNRAFRLEIAFGPSPLQTTRTCGHSGLFCSAKRILFS